MERSWARQYYRAMVAGKLISVDLTNTIIDAYIFHIWAIQDLPPKLLERSVIVLDNATFHKRKDKQTAIEAAGHSIFFLPPYSPDLSEIENTWAHAKSYKQKTGKMV